MEDVLPQAFKTLETLGKQVSVRTLDELAALNNITTSLYTLSIAESAEEAQKWLYELPTTYSRRLRQAGLLANEQLQSDRINSQSMAGTAYYVNWSSSDEPVKYEFVKGITGAGKANANFFPSSPGSVNPVTVEVETNDPNLAA